MHLFMFLVIVDAGVFAIHSVKSRQFEEFNLSPEDVIKEEFSEGYVVGLLAEENEWIYTGSLVTWQKVLTTCAAVLSEEVVYASFRPGDHTKGWQRRISQFEKDRRCGKRSIAGYLRYNIGVMHLDGPANMNYLTQLLQYPSLSKQKYLRSTEQVINRRLNCTATLITQNQTDWLGISLTMTPSHEITECEPFIGIHEFICSNGPNILNEIVTINQGTPVTCGEDAYGILVAPDRMEEDLRNATTYMLMRLDEFIHLIVDPKIDFDYYS